MPQAPACLFFVRDGSVSRRSLTRRGLRESRYGCSCSVARDETLRFHKVVEKLKSQSRAHPTVSVPLGSINIMVPLGTINHMVPLSTINEITPLGKHQLTLGYRTQELILRIVEDNQSHDSSGPVGRLLVATENSTFDATQKNVPPVQTSPRSYQAANNNHLTRGTRARFLDGVAAVDGRKQTQTPPKPYSRASSRHIAILRGHSLVSCVEALCSNPLCAARGCPCFFLP